ncbi:branched-chain amino acid ABC transporter substrate-binding protein [Terrarubrum flagellatum]|uniref:branched-chain amino acid ABC transporter substrate-binding protein n=1 Tax=Terrirubrum flagellatum TaxID=2895980 RepID=UPI0031453F05
MRKPWLVGAALAAAFIWTGPSRAQDTVKIAYIDPLSGAFADVGEQGLNHYKYMADKINAAGGVNGRKLEIIGLDNKMNPKEALVQLEKAIDMGARYITQGNGSALAAALIEAVEKHNERNPKDRVLFINYAAVDPVFTNDKCSFWHFRFDADSDMKMEIITDWLKTQPNLKKAYVLGQDYSFGQQVSAAAGRMIKAKRPDMEIVGNELHPLGRVKDFAPYITKMRAAGADVLITGNWGTDMTLLIKAAMDSGYTVPVLTYYGGGLGAPTAMGKAAVGYVKQVTEFHKNIDGMNLDAFMDDYEKTVKQDLYYLRIKNAMEMVAKAMNEAKSVDAEAVALKLEGMSIDSPTGKITMRKDNHQILMPMFISTLSDKAKRTVDNTPFGFQTDLRVEADKTAAATTCQMKRPAS